MPLLQRLYQEPIEVPVGWLTIFVGPPRSGKTTESRRLREDPNYPEFLSIEGIDSKGDVDRVISSLDKGHDVIYETTTQILHIPQELLSRAKTIEIFKRDE